MKISEEQLKNIEELARKATQGEWEESSKTFSILYTDNKGKKRKVAQIHSTYADFIFIARVNPQVVLQMIEEIRRLRDQLPADDLSNVTGGEGVKRILNSL